MGKIKKTKQIEKPPEELIQDEQKHICAKCRAKMVLSKNVKVKNEELVCRHSLILTMD